MLVLIVVLCVALVGVVLADFDIKASKVMICAIAVKEEQYIDEWLQYHKFLGVDMVQLYDNAATPSKYLSALDAIYGDFVRVKHYPGLIKQVPAYNDCLQKYKNNNTWAAFIDIDEFIVLRKHEYIKDLLLDLSPKGGAVVLNWALMGNNGEKKRAPGPVVTRFTYTTKELNEHRKTIAYLPHTAVADVHFCLMKPGFDKVDPLLRIVINDHRPGFVSNVAGHKAVAYVNHYCTKSLEEYVRKRRRGRAASGGPVPSYTTIAKAFESYNSPLAKVQDTYARDFFLRHSLGKAYTKIFLNNGTIVLPTNQTGH